MRRATAFPAALREQRVPFSVDDLQLPRACGVAAARFGRHSSSRASTLSGCPAVPSTAAEAHSDPAWWSCLGIAAALLLATGWPLEWALRLAEALR